MEPVRLNAGAESEDCYLDASVGPKCKNIFVQGGCFDVKHNVLMANVGKLFSKY